MASKFWKWGLAAVALCALPAASRAEQGGAAPEGPGAPSSVPGWQEFIAQLQTLPDRMLAKLPEAMRDDPQIKQEVTRLALSSLASSALDTLGGDVDAPQFLPMIGQVLTIGQPNADTIYRNATVSAKGAYRLTGKMGNVNQAMIAQFLPPGAKGEAEKPHLDLAKVKTDKDGRFDVLLSAERPKGYMGDWWQMDPSTIRLLLRLVSSDWANEVEPTISIERVDIPVGKPRPPAAELEQRLRALPQAVDFMALLLIDRAQRLRDEGLVNQVRVMDLDYGALQGQFYYEGAYDLADDEVLIVESTVPKTCHYRSLILTNEIYETTDWYNNHSSLNGSQAKVDSDGKLRIVISARDPGVKNWLDTAGYPRGAIQGRWTGCDSQPIPVVTKVALADLPKALPADTAMVTPEERQEILRQRRRALLERPHW